MYCCIGLAGSMPWLLNTNNMLLLTTLMTDFTDLGHNSYCSQTLLLLYVL